jgi:hypothetical protein
MTMTTGAGPPLGALLAQGTPANLPDPPRPRPTASAATRGPTRDSAPARARRKDCQLYGLVSMGGQGAEFEALGTRTPSRCIVRALTRTRPTGELNPAAS